LNSISNENISHNISFRTGRGGGFGPSGRFNTATALGDGGGERQQAKSGFYPEGKATHVKINILPATQLMGGVQAATERKSGGSLLFPFFFSSPF
jgi:hypothetical protein